MVTSAPFLIYDASAGSGKTFTLVRNYLAKLLLAPHATAYRNILAITFTNKAVAEMKSRIIENLRAFTQYPVEQEYAAMFEAVKEETGLTTPEIRKKTTAVLKSILHNYAAFEVSTIDSFTHRILRSFAKDLHIPVNFEVQLETDEILEEAVDRLLTKVGKDKLLTQTLIDFALSKADDDRSWDISFDLNKIAKLLVNENNLEALQLLKDIDLTDFSAFTKQLQQQIKTAENQAAAHAQEFLQLMQKHELVEKDFSRKSIPNFFKKVASHLFPYPLEAKWQANIETDVLYPKRVSDGTKDCIDQLQPEIAQLFRQTENAIHQRAFAKIILKNNTSLSLLTAIEKEVAQIKEERGILLISEFNKKISDSIKDEPAPFIYERLGDRYHTYFIDEFQDTSILQWQNLIPLVGDSLASANGQVTLVGDAKQSIYRWRGGRAEQFMALSGEENPFYVDKYYEALPNNYRSAAEIVNFNNAFFNHVAQYLGHQPYQQLFEKSTQVPKQTKPGYVEISFIEADNAEEEHKVYPQKIIETITRLAQQGHAYSDIAILVRKKKEGIAIADALSEEAIPIISSETLLLQKSPEVNFCINLLKYTINPNEKNIKYELLDFLYHKINPSALPYEFMKERLELKNSAFFKSLEAYGFHFDLSRFHQLPFYDAIEYSLRSFHLFENADAYLQFFLDFVYDYAENHRTGITGFLELWKLKQEKLSISIPEGGDAVQIMTIHKAKGLEFPIVIYPYANQKLDDTKRDKVWVKLADENSIPITYIDASKKMMNFSPESARVFEELLAHHELDAMNVFYVAMTRPVQQLFILSKLEIDSKTKSEKLNSFSELLINFLRAKNRWTQEKLTYTFGTAPAPQSKSKQPAPSIDLQIRSYDPTSRDIDIITKSGQLWSSHQLKAIEEGNLLHYLMQQIHTSADLPYSLNKAVLEGYILEEEKERYHQELQAILNHPEIQIYFSDQFTVYNEKELLIDGDFKRLDRICLRGQKAYILDYKTGTPTSAHKNQLQAYARALEKIGYTVEKKLLVYIGSTIEVEQVE